MENTLGSFIKSSVNMKPVPVIGLGSGAAAYTIAKALGIEFKRLGVKPGAVPSSSQIKFLVSDYYTMIEPPVSGIDIVIDGADEVSSTNNYIIKGGGGALTRERIIWEMARERHVFITKEKISRKLSHPLPAEVIPFAINLVQKKLDELGLKWQLRKDQKGYPTFTENGNMIIDIAYANQDDLRPVYEKVKLLPGVVDAGLFIYDVHLHIIEQQ
ncbi:MAG: ribose 5-phosphate isomerase A [Nitrososphaerota archaeon]|jgi:ribose 5-phosphate isomerase A|nr:ribose 5-phosphate isomerase A [Nitrososphaerota archaeon]MDG6927890.1 ribose 5-phosphate isomerase A [Nitrososphaerota archaeon]MDG6931035.1 ribose 5-phosphate isomerase A [Nitrososphaerota archaeon]MDG6932105.1 ribose 5-phosphate isomerase A [Nitrososphaerota archaeon]MDG6936660.1 ribose 5-phosphate isomerase A [Nitrososphaerota archaeon]